MKWCIHSVLRAAFACLALMDGWTLGMLERLTRGTTVGLAFLHAGTKKRWTGDPESSEVLGWWNRLGGSAYGNGQNLSYANPRLICGPAAQRELKIYRHANGYVSHHVLGFGGGVLG